MIRHDPNEVRQGINLDEIRVEGVVSSEGERYYILTDIINQTTDHMRVGLDQLFDEYVQFFSLVK